MVEKTRIYVARHGQTFWNAKRLFQGKSDIELSPMGEEQARRLGERLKDEKFDAVYTSELVRTQQTARLALNNKEQALIIDDNFSEIGFGIWEGANIDDLIANQPEQMEKFFHKPNEFNLEGMEKLEDFIGRVIKRFEELVSKHRGEQILIVAHGGVVSALKYQYLHHDLVQFWSSEPYIKPTALSILVADDGGIIFEQMPDDSHCSDLVTEQL